MRVLAVVTFALMALATFTDADRNLRGNGAKHSAVHLASQKVATKDIHVLKKAMTPPSTAAQKKKQHPVAPKAVQLAAKDADKMPAKHKEAKKKVEAKKAGKKHEKAEKPATMKKQPAAKVDVKKVDKKHEKKADQHAVKPRQLEAQKADKKDVHAKHAEVKKHEVVKKHKDKKHKDAKT